MQMDVVFQQHPILQIRSEGGVVWVEAVGASYFIPPLSTRIDFSPTRNLPYIFVTKEIWPVLLCVTASGYREPPLIPVLRALPDVWRRADTIFERRASIPFSA